MESVFEIIAEPNRRAILSPLLSSQQSVGEIASVRPQPTVSEHLRVLREARFSWNPRWTYSAVSTG